MPESLNGLDRVPAAMHAGIRAYADQVRLLAGENARSLTLFGAIVAGRFDPKRHAARNVLVLGRIDLDMLRQLAQQGARLGKAGIAAPLVMTPDYIQASLDTFALELIEIQQQHVTLFGEDAFAGLSFEAAHVRLQCERELKALLIRLRQGLLAAAGREKLFGEIHADVAEGLLRTMRGMLWLRGEKSAKPAAAVIEETETIAEARLDGIRGAVEPAGEHGWDEFRALYDDVARLGKIVDAW
jgi:hypothetical protein